jgi:hypothetical protein
MIKTKKTYLKLREIVFGFLFLLPSVLWAGGPGTTGAVELKIPVAPEAIAMGGAFVAVANDANSVYWNPAGLLQLHGIHITTQYSAFLNTLKYEYLAIGSPLGNNNDYAVGLATKILSSGEVPAVDANGNPTGGYVGENYMDVDLAGAIRLNYWLNLGLTAKYISKNLSGVSASTFAIDLGLLYFTPIPHLRAGLDIQNLGPGLKFETVSDPLPIIIRTGVAYKLFNDNFTTSFELDFPSDNKPAVSVGGEYWYMNTLVGRFGYQYQGAIDVNELGIGALSGLYLGMGVKFRAFGSYFGFDYSWSDAGFLGNTALGQINNFALNAYL